MLDNNVATIEQAIDDLKQGKMIILVDDKGRENEGDLVIAAEWVTPDAINFMTRFGRGLVCMPMQQQDFDRLRIPPMARENQSHYHTAFGVSIGARDGITTGISAHDRARTIKTAIDENNGPQSIVMPGHIFPLAAKPNGVLQRNGHTEGSVDLARLAGLKPAAVICEVMNDDGTMARMPELIDFAKDHKLNIVSIQDLVRYRLTHETLVEEQANSDLPINDDRFSIRVFRSTFDDREPIALQKCIEKNALPLVRIHSECLTGDVFGSSRCDCGLQLRHALMQITKEGGVLIYLRQEGRGIGIINKIKAYALQDQGYDTVEANHQLGLAADCRDYAMAAQVLRTLDMPQIRLLTNNPRKMQDLQDYGIDVVERIPLEMKPSTHNIEYMRCKRDKLGHLLTLGEEYVKAVD